MKVLVAVLFCAVCVTTISEVISEVTQPRGDQVIADVDFRTPKERAQDLLDIIKKWKDVEIESKNSKSNKDDKIRELESKNDILQTQFDKIKEENSQNNVTLTGLRKEIADLNGKLAKVTQQCECKDEKQLLAECNSDKTKKDATITMQREKIDNLESKQKCQVEQNEIKELKNMLTQREKEIYELSKLPSNPIDIPQPKPRDDADFGVILSQQIDQVKNLTSLQDKLIEVSKPQLENIVDGFSNVQSNLKDLISLYNTLISFSNVSVSGGSAESFSNINGLGKNIQTMTQGINNAQAILKFEDAPYSQILNVVNKVLQAAETLENIAKQLDADNFKINTEDGDQTHLIQNEINVMKEMGKNSKILKSKLDQETNRQLDEREKIIKDIIPNVLAIEETNFKYAGGKVIMDSDDSKKAQQIVNQITKINHLADFLNFHERDDGLTFGPEDKLINYEKIGTALNQIIGNNKIIQEETPTIVVGVNRPSTLISTQYEIIDEIDKLISSAQIDRADLSLDEQNKELTKTLNKFFELSESLEKNTELIKETKMPKSIKNYIKKIDEFLDKIETVKEEIEDLKFKPIENQVSDRTRIITNLKNLPDDWKESPQIAVEIPLPSRPISQTNQGIFKDVITKSKLEQLIDQIQMKVENYSPENATQILNFVKQTINNEAPQNEIITMTCAKSKSDSKCTVQGLLIKDSNVKVSAVVKTESPSLNVQKIDEVVIEGQNMLFLPKDLKDFIPKVEKLIISGSSLLRLRPDDFTGLTSLKHLAITQNDLKEIDPKVFESLTNLQTLDISNNKIEKLDIDVFKHLKKLKEIRINGNNLTSITSRLFEYNPKLDKVWLNENQLKELNPKFVDDFKRISYVNLDDNVCTQVIMYDGESETIDEIKQKCSSGATVNCNFSDNYKCTAFNLIVKDEKTKIVEANGEHKYGKNNKDVNELIVKTQEMNFMPSGFEQVFINLIKITIDNSTLIKITKRGFSQISKLRELVIVNNQLKSMDSDSFSQNIQLQKIDLGNNKLNRLPAYTFRGLRSLKTLKLNNNDFSRLNMNDIDCPSSIQHFDVSSNNALTAVEANIINVCLKKARYIDFADVKCLRDVLDGIYGDYKLDKDSVKPNDRAKTLRIDEFFGPIETHCKIR